jgi:hypothetical protein
MQEERAVPLSDWPQPDGGAPMPVTVADESSLFVRYYTMTRKVVVVHFPLCSVFTFGSPNDEVLAGHPLYGRGLKFYSVHQVENSSWIASLEQRNRVHPRHDRKRFLEDMKHYVFTFHDSTLECVVTEGKYWQTEIATLDTVDDADNYIHEKRKRR